MSNLEPKKNYTGAFALSCDLTLILAGVAIGSILFNPERTTKIDPFTFAHVNGDNTKDAIMIHEYYKGKETHVRLGFVDGKYVALDKGDQYITTKKPTYFDHDTLLPPKDGVKRTIEFGDGNGDGKLDAIITDVDSTKGSLHNTTVRTLELTNPEFRAFMESERNLMDWY